MDEWVNFYGVVRAWSWAFVRRLLVKRFLGGILNGINKECETYDNGEDNE